MTVPPTPAPTSPADENAQHFRLVLRKLVDMSLDLAETLHAEAKAQAQADQPAKLAAAVTAFDTTARSIRRTILLAQRLDEPRRTAAHQRAAARRRILREVEDSIEREARAYEQDHLRAELHERLDSPDILEDIGDRPVEDIIKDICRDLGLANIHGARPWPRRTPADIAALCARAAEPQPAPLKPTLSPAGATEEPERFFRLVPTPNHQAS